MVKIVVMNCVQLQVTIDSYLCKWLWCNAMRLEIVGNAVTGHNLEVLYELIIRRLFPCVKR